MSDFYELLDEYLGDDDDLTEIRVVVRRCWFYDFLDYPLYLWQGKGKLITSDNQEWLGTIDANNVDHHVTPAIKDGRDGSSGRYNFGLKLTDIPGQNVQQMYDDIKSEQNRAFGRSLTCYLVLFDLNEGLRPQTPKVFFKQFTMMNTKFSEKMELVNGVVTKSYSTFVVAKDGNFGRSEIPNGTYADPIQRERARQLGVDADDSCEFVAGLANRTYQIP